MSKIVIDLMGGDAGSEITIKAIKSYLNSVKIDENNDAFILVGDNKALESLCEFEDKPYIKLVESKTVVAMDVDPMSALKDKESSLMVAIKELLDNDYDSIISAGSTGALLTASIFKIKRIEGVKRPGLITTLPTYIENKKTVMLDLGANLENTAEELAQFGLLGSIYYNLAFNEAKPKVFLLNNGTEEEKGRKEHKEAHQLLKNDSRINFVGNIEGREVLSGNADVVVSDGFSGNIFLKTTEGTVKLVTSLLKDAIYSSTKTKIAGLLLKSKMSEFKEKLNYKNIGGAMLIGVNKIVIKAHGSSDEKAFLSAIKLANDLGNKKLVEKVKEKLKENN